MEHLLIILLFFAETVEVQQAYESQDVSYNIYPLLVTTLVECWMILILACIPPLRYFFVKAYQKTKAVTFAHISADDSKLSRARITVAVPLSDLQRKSEVGWKRPQSTVKDFDNDSEEEILSNTQNRKYETSYKARGDPGITITQDFDVSYEGARRQV